MSSFINFVNNFRRQNSDRYGVSGSKKGQTGYVAGGWRRAVADGAAEWRASHPPAQHRPSRRIAMKDLTSQERVALQNYKFGVWELKKQYYPQLSRIGRHVPKAALKSLRCLA